MNAAFDVVVPTIGRPSLARFLASLARASGPWPERVVLVDDRRDRRSPLALGDLRELGELATRMTVVPGAARGPAAARNRGWRRASAPWIAFLDDDVIVGPAWRDELAADLAAADSADADGSQGNVRVPLPADRAPTDYERNVGRLEGAPFITADCAYRRDALARVDGFDERFTRAYREDTDLAVRLLAYGATIVRGVRRTEHPVRPADAWVSVRLQAGNADDAIMQALHGDDWTAESQAVHAAFARHVATAVFGFAAVTCGCAWFASTLRFAWRRIEPGPRDAREIATMLFTSAAIPFVAVTQRIRARVAMRGTLARTHRLPAAVLFDRDGTLVFDEPTSREPDDVRAMPGAVAAVARLRAAGIATGVVTNQPRVGEGTLARATMDATNARIDALFGDFDVWCACTHARDAGCSCRKPAPGLIVDAARRLGVDPAACVVVGDIGSDVSAARAAGARAVLVPTVVTRDEEVDAAPFVASDLDGAVEAILDGRV